MDRAAQRTALGAAQAQGKLARVKLDMKDAIETAFSEVAALHRNRLIEAFEEELEAFCQDLRLAGITIQQQIERKAPENKNNIGCGVVTFWTAIAVILFFGIKNVFN